MARTDLRRYFSPRRIVRALRRRNRMPLYNIGYRLAGSLDGYPLPPAHLVDLVIGTRELAWYQLGGLFMHQAIAACLRRNGTPIESVGSMLDFGCGCGRISRWWAALRDQCEIWGCDYNPALVAWCQQELSGIAQYRVNQADPPLEFPDGKFEFVYAYSVFTHFAVNRQLPWFREMARVVKPGGLLLVTVHGRRVAWRLGLSAEQLGQLEDRGMLAVGEERDGQNYCTAYHSHRFMTELKTIGLDMMDFLEGGVRDSSEQDMYLFRRL
jgi:SAM-dependent methyltransferase